MEEKLRNLTYVVVLGFIILGLLIIGLYFKDGDTSTSKTNNNTNGSQSSSSEYDVSHMNEISVDDAIDLFDEKGTHVVYIGRSGCTYCREFVPVLNEVQEELGFTTNYIDAQPLMNNWSEAREELAPLAELLDVEASANGKTGTLGELFLEKGYTPALIVIKDGKAVEGFFGYRDKEQLTKVLEEYL